jgi:uncharacterized protein
VNEDDEEFLEGKGEPEDTDLDDLIRNARSLEPSSFMDSGSDLTSEIENRQPRKLDEKEVKVQGVYEHQEQGMAPSAFVLVKDNQGRQVVIFIGRPEAVAISVALEGASFPRPMTHDLLKIVIERLGGRVERIVIDDLWQETYYARISVCANAEVLEIDSRPSDAIALALRVGAPIYMAESVLEQSASEDGI